MHTLLLLQEYFLSSSSSSSVYFVEPLHSEYCEMSQRLLSLRSSSSSSSSPVASVCFVVKKRTIMSSTRIRRRSTDNALNRVKSIAKDRAEEDHRSAINENERLVKEGDEIPEAKLSFFDYEGNLQTMETKNIFSKENTVVIFAVPGAFLPTCTNKHLPGFIDLAQEMKQHGCDLLCCVAVNDAFTMDAWGKAVGCAGSVVMFGDGSAEFTKKLGCELDLRDKGLGVRSRRYAMIVRGGVVEYLEMERGGAFTSSRAETVLAKLIEIEKKKKNERTNER
jgi:peroxiredoxin